MATKRPSIQGSGTGEPPGKKTKLSSNNHDEHPADYSNAVRQKLQDNNKSRTGQACDRCKERKMRCDPNPMGCKPCQDKDVPCRTTDRITGRASERGHAERLEAQIHMLKKQLGRYSSKYGPMDGTEELIDDASAEYANTGFPRIEPDHPLTQYKGSSNSPAFTPREPEKRPIYGTKVDVMGATIDIANFYCPQMDDETEAGGGARVVFNNSRSSFLSTAMGGPRPEKPDVSKQEAMSFIGTYVQAIGPFVGTLHAPSFMHLAHRYFEDRSFKPSIPETVMIYTVIAIVALQMAVRNPTTKGPTYRELSSKSYHYALSFFPELQRESSLASMQALNLLLIQSRNLPKPGNSWGLSTLLLNRCIDLNYHRAAHKISIRRGLLETELRKRVFWSIFSIVVSVALKLGRPMPLRMEDIDVEMPLAIEDSELSDQGIVSSLSGKCNFRPAYFIYQQCSLLLTLYNKIMSVELPEAEYVQTLESLESDITKWEREYELEAGRDEQDDGSFKVKGLFISTWAAETRLLLHHPSFCMTSSKEVRENSLDICHRASMTLLGNLQCLFDKFRGADFTWHMTVTFVLAAGMAVYVHDQRKQSITRERYSNMQHELRDWLRIMSSADKIIACGDLLFRSMTPHVEKCLAESRNILVASAALQNGYHPDTQMQPPQNHTGQVNPSGEVAQYSQEHYATPSAPNPPPAHQTQPPAPAYPDPTAPNTQQSQPQPTPFVQAPPPPAPPPPPQPYEYPAPTYNDVTAATYGSYTTPASTAVSAYYATNPQQTHPATALMSMSQAGVIDDGGGGGGQSNMMWPNTIFGN